MLDLNINNYQIEKNKTASNRNKNDTPRTRPLIPHRTWFRFNETEMFDMYTRNEERRGIDRRFSTRIVSRVEIKNGGGGGEERKGPSYPLPSQVS